MPSFRLQGFQSVIRGNSHLLRHQQRRWAQVHDVRFLASHHDPKYVLDKYRSKLDKKAKEEGHDSVESLKEAYDKKIQELRRKASTPVTPEPGTPTPTTAVPGTTPAFHPPPPPQESRTTQAARKVSSDSSPVKPLSTYLDVEKIRELPPKEIEALWRLRFAENPNAITAAIPPRHIQAHDAAEQNPEGVTGTAADIHFLQWAFHPPAEGSTLSPSNNHTSTVIFTNLGVYKMHGAFAQPHTTITHHLDLADEKGLVLMHGQIIPEGGVSATEATWLVSCVQRFYDFEGLAAGRKSELVRMFTRGDVENFKVEELLVEAEKLP
ncbi:ATP mitochondrial protein 11 [Penicillium fimorum]|uniref:ATP mitochondrial protein 11 n=1 Tax=Penicillium fimorum TaxID=1882269 RepID=A0A9W9XP28_9EURO|nr:ATP mitochondrial protein 11 [Penicillium fimorum]